MRKLVAILAAYVVLRIGFQACDDQNPDPMPEPATEASRAPNRPCRELHFGSKIPL